MVVQVVPGLVMIIGLVHLLFMVGAEEVALIMGVVVPVVLVAEVLEQRVEVLPLDQPTLVEEVGEQILRLLRMAVLAVRALLLLGTLMIHSKLAGLILLLCQPQQQHRQHQLKEILS
jgi:hypothetical protein